jgi:glycine/D-amino acid oxidase-like deaminating enzyme
MVIDTGALIELLQNRYAEHIFQADVSLRFENDHPVVHLSDGVKLRANRIILAAGQGNGALAQGIPKRPVTMQLRPLKQVMVKGELPKVYAHAVSLRDAAKPRLTITTHPMPDGSNVWYLGGNLAEQGVDMSDEALIAKAKSELKQLLPWIDTNNHEYRTLSIDRAEPSQTSGNRPDDPFVHISGDVLTCWPTKLTLTPMLGAEVLKQLPPPGNEKLQPLQLPLATRSPFPWELAFA